MWKSLKEYVTALGHWGWIVLVDIFSGITGAYLDVSGIEGFPTWLWVTLLGIALIISPFIAFHKLRKQRDELVTSLEKRKTIQLSNKEELIRAISEFRNSAIQYINTKDNLVWWENERPNSINVELVNKKDEAKYRYDKASDKFDGEILVAGGEINSNLKGLRSFIDFYVLTIDLPDVIKGYDSVKDVLSKINKLVDSTVKKIQAIG